jgi:hypothetical protein
MKKYLYVNKYYKFIIREERFFKEFKHRPNLINPYSHILQFLFENFYFFLNLK